MTSVRMMSVRMMSVRMTSSTIFVSKVMSGVSKYIGIKRDINNNNSNKKNSKTIKEN